MLSESIFDVSVKGKKLEFEMKPLASFKNKSQLQIITELV